MKVPIHDNFCRYLTYFNKKIFIIYKNTYFDQI